MWMANNGTLGASTLKGGYTAALTLNNVQRTAPFAVLGASPRLLVRARCKSLLCCGPSWTSVSSVQWSK